MSVNPRLLMHTASSRTKMTEAAQQRSSTPVGRARDFDSRPSTPTHYGVSTGSAFGGRSARGSGTTTPLPERVDLAARPRAATPRAQSPNAHHKNLVYMEDPSVDTTRVKLWAAKPLRNGSFEVPSKRRYDLPGHFAQTYDIFRGESEPVAAAPPMRHGPHVSESALLGAAAVVVEEPKPMRPMVKKLHEPVLRTPWMETDPVSGRNDGPADVPAPIGKMHVPEPKPQGPTEKFDSIRIFSHFSAQPVERTHGVRRDVASRTNATTLYMADAPPPPESIPKFRPSKTVMDGAPPFHPDPPRAPSRGNSPSRRMMHTPVDNDIFGTRALRASSPVAAAAVPLPATEGPRGRAFGAYSPHRLANGGHHPVYTF